MTPPDWWYAGILLGLTIFFCLLLLVTWLFLRWGIRQVDQLDAEIHAIDEAQKAFEADMKQRLWGDDMK